MPAYILAAIYRKLDTLAERYGISPSEFIAALQHDPHTGQTSLQLKLTGGVNTIKEERFDKLLRAIGAVPADVPHVGFLKASKPDIMHTLNHALTFAPDLRRDSSSA